MILHMVKVFFIHIQVKSYADAFFFFFPATTNWFETFFVSVAGAGPDMGTVDETGFPSFRRMNSVAKCDT